MATPAVEEAELGSKTVVRIRTTGSSPVSGDT